MLNTLYMDITFIISSIHGYGICIQEAVPIYSLGGVPSFLLLSEVVINICVVHCDLLSSIIPSLNIQVISA